MTAVKKFEIKKKIKLSNQLTLNIITAIKQFKVKIISILELPNHLKLKASCILEIENI